MKMLWFYISYPLRLALKNKVDQHRLWIGNKAHLKPKARRRGLTAGMMLIYARIQMKVRFVERWTTSKYEYLNGYQTPEQFKDWRFQH